MSVDSQRDNPALEHIEAAQRQLYGVKARWKLLSAFQDELIERTRGEEFVIDGAATWRALIDARDMMVVHFSEWAVAAYSPGGLFGQLAALSPKEMYVKKRPDPSARANVLTPTATTEEEKEDIAHSVAGWLHQQRRDIFAKRFPKAAKKNRKPNQHDYARLRDELEDELAPVVSDRHHNRAHPPYGARKGDRAKAKMLNLETIRTHLDYAFGILNDLRVLVDRSSYVDDGPDVKRDAEDLVDLVLFGSKRRLDFLSGLSEAAKKGEGKYAYQYRERFYDRLHQERQLTTGPSTIPTISGGAPARDE